jgi:hypothetical protein
MRLIISLLAVLLLLQPTVTAEITYQNLKLFFEATYDTNKDGSATVQEFVEYFQFM